MSLNSQMCTVVLAGLLEVNKIQILFCHCYYTFKTGLTPLITILTITTRVQFSLLYIILLCCTPARDAAPTYYWYVVGFGITL